MLMHLFRIPLTCLLLLCSYTSFTQKAPEFPTAGLFNAKISPDGNLEIHASKTSSLHDFEFLTGKWTMEHQRLKKRLVGKRVIVMFRWDKTDKEHPVWSQAFSPDKGSSWELNWTNTSYRIKTNPTKK